MEKKERSFNEDQLYAASSFIDTAKAFLEFDFSNFELIHSKLELDDRDQIKRTITLYTNGIKKILEKIQNKTENFDILSTSIIIIDFGFNLRDADYKLNVVINDFKKLISISDLSFKNSEFENFYNVCSEANTSIMNIYTAILANDDFSLAREALKRIEYIENKARQAAGITAAYDISKHFDDEANSYKTSTGFWFCGIILNIIITISLIILIDPFYFFLQKINWVYLDGELKIYSFFTVKISLVATSLIVLFFSIKNYNINKHNNIVNKYKAVIMKTLPAIFTQYPDADKKVFYEKLAAFLFKSQDTGMGKNTDPSTPYDKVIEMFTKK